MEQEYPEDGITFGCAVIYGLLLAFAGLVFAGYVLIGGVPAVLADAAGGPSVATAFVVLAGLGAVGVGAGLWYEQSWARWLVVVVHTVAALAGLGVALLPLVEAGSDRPISSLATPATALMGVVVNVVIVYWFWRNWGAEDEER